MDTILFKNVPPMGLFLLEEHGPVYIKCDEWTGRPAHLSGAAHRVQIAKATWVIAVGGTDYEGQDHG